MNKKIYLDFLLNFMAFFLLIGSQQLLLLPYLSRILLDQEFSLVLIVFAIANIVGSSVGTSLSNMKHLKYRSHQSSSQEAKYFLLKVSVFASVISVIIYFVFSQNQNIVDYVLIYIIYLFTIFRLYLTAERRFEKKYKIIVIASLIYFLLIVFMIFLKAYLLKDFYFYWPAVIFCAEFLSVLVLVLGHERYQESGQVTRDTFKETMSSFIPFSVNEALTSITSYSDRFVLYPYITPYQLNAYFSASAIAKFALMIINPVSNVILSWLSSSNDSSQKKRERKLLLYGATFIFLIFSPILYLVTPILVRIMYPDFYELALNLIPYVVAINALGLVTSIINPYNLRNGKIRLIYQINLGYLLCFLVMGIFTIYYFDLETFLLVSLVLKLSQTIFYLTIFLKKEKIN